MTRVRLFLGPTLSADDAEDALDGSGAELEVLPPVSQGSLHRAAVAGAEVAGIVDGYFDRVPAVWHKEILWAMERGIRVYGAASLGALRAAELCSFGMIGVGEIFEAYRCGAIEDDDEVAVAHASACDGFRSVSVAMVDIRATLSRAAACGVVSRNVTEELTCVAKRLFYPDRTWPALLASLAPGDRAALRDWLRAGVVHQKRADALAMLARIRRDLAERLPPLEVGYHMERTLHFERAMHDATTDSAHGEGLELSSDDVLDELRLDRPLFERTAERAVARALGLRAARAEAVTVDEGAIAAHRERMYSRRELHTGDARAAWLSSNDLTPAAFEGLVRDEALLLGLGSDVEPRRLLEQLRLDGSYVQLCRRAAEKRAVLEARGWLDVTLEEVGVDLPSLFTWLFDRSGWPGTTNRLATARAFGFESSEAFVRSALREYLWEANPDGSDRREAPGERSARRRAARRRPRCPRVRRNSSRR